MSKAVDIADVTNQASFRNLIINGDFRVNQRGAASRTATTNAYNYDRWYYDGTYLYQGVEDLSVANGTYTLSWVDAGSDITAAYVVSTDSSNNNGPDSGLTYTSVSNGGNITVSEGTEYSKHLWIRFGGTLANLSKVQLEAGTVATPFERRLIGTELMLCQRYYARYTSDGSNYGPAFLGTFNSNTQCIAVHKHTVPMRAAATLGHSQLSDFDIEPFDEAPSGISSFSYVGTDFHSIDFTSPTARTQGLSAFLTIDVNGGYLDFDAEL